jgi:quinol monooxygenase YgiN
MFARHVTIQLKPEVAHEFPLIAENIQKEIHSLLRKQKGFIQELVLTAPNQNEAVAISLWEEKEHAEKFKREVYPTIVKLLNKYVEGTPVVKEFESPIAAVPVLRKLARAGTI